MPQLKWDADNIIFGSVADSLSLEFVVEMKTKFEMSMLGEISFFLVYILHKLQKACSFPRKVPQRNIEQIWNGRVFTCWYSCGHWV